MALPWISLSFLSAGRVTLQNVLHNVPELDVVRGSGEEASVFSDLLSDIAMPWAWEVGEDPTPRKPNGIFSLTYA